MTTKQLFKLLEFAKLNFPEDKNLKDCLIISLIELEGLSLQKAIENIEKIFVPKFSVVEDIENLVIQKRPGYDLCLVFICGETI